MKTPLTQINGSKNLPQKTDGNGPWAVGYDQAVDQINQCAISLDEEELTWMIRPFIEDKYGVQKLATAICQNAGKILKIERV